jgi:hypothetical protein
MTLRYIKVTQQDLQREFYAARQKTVSSQLVATLSSPNRGSTAAADVLGILQAISSTCHLLEMYRRKLGNEQTSKKLRRLAKRLLSVATEFRCFTTPGK